MAVKQKILIVDDDNNIAELISLYLTKECYDTRIVNDGEEALKAFASFAPNLILLDLMLPGMDGYQVCREIRHKSNVPIIMLSAKERSSIKSGPGTGGRRLYDQAFRLQRTGCPGKSRTPQVSAYSGPGNTACRKIRGISGSGH